FNCRRSLLTASPKGAAGIIRCPETWCPEEDSNLHGVTRQYLKLVRLPIPPSGPCKEQEILANEPKNVHKDQRPGDLRGGDSQPRRGPGSTHRARRSRPRGAP